MTPTAGISPGAAHATLMPSGSARSSCSRRASPRARPTGSASWRLSRTCSGSPPPPRTRCSGSGRGSATTAAHATCTPPRNRSWRWGASRTTSEASARSRVWETTRLRPSAPSPSACPRPSWTAMSTVCWPGTSGSARPSGPPPPRRNSPPWRSRCCRRTGRATSTRR